MTTPNHSASVLILDIDGVIAPVGGNTEWGDDIKVSQGVTPVHVSPAMCRELEAIGSTPGTEVLWLTDWTYDERSRLAPFPGKDWSVVASPNSGPSAARAWAGELWPVVPWWKWWALDAWLHTRPGLRRIAWADDNLAPFIQPFADPSPSRRAWSLSAALREADVEATLLNPDSSRGLTAGDIDAIRQHLHAGTT